VTSAFLIAFDAILVEIVQELTTKTF